MYRLVSVRHGSVLRDWDSTEAVTHSEYVDLMFPKCGKTDVERISSLSCQNKWLKSFSSAVESHSSESTAKWFSISLWEMCWILVNTTKSLTCVRRPKPAVWSTRFTPLYSLTCQMWRLHWNNLPCAWALIPFPTSPNSKWHREVKK